MYYIHFISGMPDLSFEDTKIPYSVEDCKHELNKILSKRDGKLVEALFLKYDNQNLLAYLRNQETEFDSKGAFVKEEVETLLHEIKEEEKISNKNFPSYFKIFISEYYDEEKTEKPLFWEDRLASLYYDFLGKTKNEFVRRWADMNLNIHNILLALTCRRMGIESAPYIVGCNQVSEKLRTSKTRDFDLPEIFEMFDSIRLIDEETNLVAKEHKIERLCWNWIDDENIFKYFSVEIVIAHLLKLQMLERWITLNDDSGKQRFKNLVHHLRKGSLNLKDL